MAINGEPIPGQDPSFGLGKYIPDHDKRNGYKKLDEGPNHITYETEWNGQPTISDKIFGGSQESEGERSLTAERTVTGNYATLEVINDMVASYQVARDLGETTAGVSPDRNESGTFAWAAYQKGHLNKVSTGTVFSKPISFRDAVPSPMVEVRYQESYTLGSFDATDVLPPYDNGDFFIDTNHFHSEDLSLENNGWEIKPIEIEEEGETKRQKNACMVSNEKLGLTYKIEFNVKQDKLDGEPDDRRKQYLELVQTHMKTRQQKIAQAGVVVDQDKVQNLAFGPSKTKDEKGQIGFPWKGVSSAVRFGVRETHPLQSMLERLRNFSRRPELPPEE